MARRPLPPPEDHVLTVPEMRSGIERLTRRIQELKAFDSQSVSAHRSSEIVSLETAIEDTLAAVFGQGTPKFKRYRPACDLEPAPTLTLTPSWIGARGGGGGRTGENLNQLRHGIDERKQRALALLEQAVRGLEEEIEQRPPDTAFCLDDAASQQPIVADARKVFVVHGHDEAALQAVARFLEQLDLDAIVLRERPDQGRATIEKFEHYARQVGFAVVLLTPDDIAGSSVPASATRARQNVIFELGYFAGKLGRGRACLLRKGDVEIPSDLYGVIYTDLDAAGGWKIKLVQELKAASLDFDANKMWS
jgi:predicted nucleotide-binding protein